MKTILQAAASRDEKITGYLGARVSPQLERQFKAYCKRLGLSVADGLRGLIEAELKQAGGAVPSVSPAISAPAPVTTDIPSNSHLNTSKGSAKGELNHYIVLDENGSKLMPCPICRTFPQYSTFKGRHTKKHGYADTQQMFNANARIVADMLEQYKKQGL